MRKLIWLSYDLGVTGDYESLYSWLDDRHAKECGDNVAALSFEYEGDNLVAALRGSLEAQLEKIPKRYRVYVIWNDEGTVRGKFVFGRRKASPWQGYGTAAIGPDEEAA